MFFFRRRADSPCAFIFDFPEEYYALFLQYYALQKRLLQAGTSFASADGKTQKNFSVKLQINMKNV